MKTKTDICLLSALFLIIALANAAKAVEMLDDRDDLKAYCRDIAALNSEIEKESLLIVSRGNNKSTLLCRTRGYDISFNSKGLIKIIRGPENRSVLVFESDELAEKALEELKSREDVIYAEIDGAVHSSAAGGIYFHSNGAERMSFAPYIDFVQSVQSGKVIVAIIDSGVAGHSFLQGRLISGGFDYVDVDDDPSSDLFGHGTHIAGIVADVTQGTETYIYPIRVLNASGNGKISNVAAGVLEAASAGVQVINLSLESYVISEALEDAIRTALKRGITVVCAAGNSGESTDQVCPARMRDSGVIVVGSCEADEGKITKAAYSNHGRSVDVYACGSNICSCSRSGGYVTQSGTSQAAAHISGACALMLLVWNNASPETIEYRLKVNSSGTPAFVQMVGMTPFPGQFYLTDLYICKGDILKLPVMFLPETAFLPIEWSLQDSNVIQIGNDGELLATGQGKTVLHGESTGCSPFDILITVVQEASAKTVISSVHISEEAFWNTLMTDVELTDQVCSIGDRAFGNCQRLGLMKIPETVTEIGEQVFINSEQVVILCAYSSPAYKYAIENGLQYIACN